MKRRRINWKHLLAIALLLGSVALCLFVYKYPLVRLWESISAFGRAIAYAFLDLMDLYESHPVAQTVNDYSRVDLISAIGIDFAELWRRISGVWSEIFVKENFFYYLIFLLYHFTRFIYHACILLLIGVAFAIPIIFTWDDVNNDYNKDTAPLKIFKRIIAAPCRRVFEWCREFTRFFRASRHWSWFVFIWLINFGIISVIFSFFAYYFWAITAFDLSTIGIQFVKLVADALLMLNTLPWYAWALIFAILRDIWRHRKRMGTSPIC